MYVIYKCGYGPQVGCLWSTERKLHRFSVIYNNITVINITNRTRTKTPDRAYFSDTCIIKYIVRLMSRAKQRLAGPSGRAV